MKYNMKDFIEVTRYSGEARAKGSFVAIDKNVLRISSELGKQYKAYKYLNVFVNENEQLLLLKFNNKQISNSYKLNWQGNSCSISSSSLSKKELIKNDPKYKYKFKPVEITEDSILVDLSSPFETKKNNK